jgi:hypothetical protein
LEQAKEELQTLDGTPVSDAQAEVLMKIGAIRAVDSIADALSSQTLRNLQQIRDQELFKALGFKRFKDFMESDRAPMNYQKFNRLEGAIEREGDALFDYLNAIDAPLSKRKLLGRGDVRVEGKEVVAHVEGEEEEIRVPLNNTARLLSVLSRVVEQRNEQARRIARGKKEVKSLKEKVAELADGNGHNGAGQGGYMDAVLNLIGSFSLLATEIEKLPEAKRAELRTQFFDTVGENMKRVDEAFGLQKPAKTVRVPKHLHDGED